MQISVTAKAGRIIFESLPVAVLLGGVIRLSAFRFRLKTMGLDCWQLSRHALRPLVS